MLYAFLEILKQVNFYFNRANKTPEKLDDIG